MEVHLWCHGFPGTAWRDAGMSWTCVSVVDHVLPWCSSTKFNFQIMLIAFAGSNAVRTPARASTLPGTGWFLSGSVVLRRDGTVLSFPWKWHIAQVAQHYPSKLKPASVSISSLLKMGYCWALRSWNRCDHRHAKYTGYETGGVMFHQICSGSGKGSSRWLECGCGACEHNMYPAVAGCPSLPLQEPGTRQVPLGLIWIIPTYIPDVDHMACLCKV